MIAHIYTKNSGDYTSILVSDDKGDVYFQDVMEVPEITGIQRGASFVKNQLNSEKTEIYPDKLKKEDVEKDVYINYCKINASVGTNPNEKAKTLCSTNLMIHNRWNLKGTEYER